MKIERITSFVLRVGLNDNTFYSSQCAFPQRNSLLVRVETDSGLVGWGEGGQYGPPEPVAAVVDSVLTPILLGRDPMHVGRLWEELYAATRDFGRAGAYIEAISAVDIACWDIRGQALGVPVHALLGGAFRDTVAAYATGCYYRESDMTDHKARLPALAEEAGKYMAQGFGILKMKVGLLPVAQDLERVAAVRSAIGDDTPLLVDCNHAYDCHTALRMGRGLEHYGALWMEEPVPPEDHAGYRRLRAALELAVTGGECEYTRYGFRDLIGTSCVDVAQPDICVAGGFSEWLKIQALASAFAVPTVPHVWGSGVALAAALHALAALPPLPHTAKPVPLQNEPIIEFDRNHNPLRDDLLEQTFTLEDGRVRVPQGAGLGITLDETVLEKFAVH